jgi:hypothetical protein
MSHDEERVDGRRVQHERDRAPRHRLDLFVRLIHQEFQGKLSRSRHPNRNPAKQTPVNKTRTATAMRILESTLFRGLQEPDPWGNNGPKLSLAAGISPHTWLSSE